jgi:hypothetical protein
MAELDPVPDLLTVEEAARVLRIGRTAAYAQARVARETAGRVGIPNITIGGQYRVPRGDLEARIGRPITHIPSESSAAARGGRAGRHGGGTDGSVGAVRPLRTSRPRRLPEPPQGGVQGSLL